VRRDNQTRKKTSKLPGKKGGIPRAKPFARQPAAREKPNRKQRGWGNGGCRLGKGLYGFEFRESSPSTKAGPFQDDNGIFKRPEGFRKKKKKRTTERLGKKVGRYCRLGKKKQKSGGGTTKNLGVLGVGGGKMSIGGKHREGNQQKTPSITKESRIKSNSGEKANS